MLTEHVRSMSKERPKIASKGRFPSDLVIGV